MINRWKVGGIGNGLFEGPKRSAFSVSFTGGEATAVEDGGAGVSAVPPSILAKHASACCSARKPAQPSLRRPSARPQLPRRLH